MNKVKFRIKKKKKENLKIIIEARSTSKRLKRKHLYKINNLSLIRILIKRLKKIKKIGGIILSTTNNSADDNLVNEAKKEKILIFRGDEKNVLKRVIDTCEKYKLDSFCRITGDNIIIDVEYVQLLIDNYLHNLNLDYISNSIYMPPGQGAAIVKLDALKKGVKYSFKNKKYREFITLHILENQKKFKVYFLHHGNDIFRYKKKTSLDNLNDLEFLRKLSNKFDLKKVTLRQLINFKN